MSALAFDRWAPYYDSSALQPAYLAAHDAVLRHLLLRSGCPQRVLDVGCGTGRLLATAARLLPATTLVGVDISAGMLATATARPMPITGPCHFVRAAAECLPFPAASFDVVVSTASYHHWADPTAAVQEIGRVLTRHGLLCVADLTTGTGRRRLTRRTRLRDLAPTLAPALGMADLRPLVTETIRGFGPISAITIIVARHQPR